MGNIINTIQDENGIYKQDTVNQQVTTEILQDVAALSHALQASNNELSYQIMQHNTLLASVENANQRYINAENNRQWIYNNEVETYNTLLNNQNNLLTRINQYKVKLWRYKNKLYYRTNSGELIIKNQVEMQKELSSRYGLDVYIVYDLNDVLQNNTQLRVNTVFIAINCLLVVDQEIVEPNNKNEILQYTDGTVKRNLLAHTRYKKDRLLNNSTSDTFTKKVMSSITERNSDCISSWIKNIGAENDTILLLVGNKKLSEDIIVDKVIKRLFNTGLATTLTDEMLQNKSFEDIVEGKLFLHIEHIPQDEKDRDKLKELIISIVIHKSVLSNGYTIPIQVKVIVTIDEVHSFFQGMMEITKTLFMDTEKNVLQKLYYDSLTALYKGIEESLDYYSAEVSSMKDKQFNSYKNDNNRYLESLRENNDNTSLTSETQIPILDPFNDSFEHLIPIVERYKHTYITGMTGSGKSELLKVLIMTDILRVDGSVILLEPHGDLSHDVTKLVKEKSRLVYVNPFLSESKTPTINLFHLSNKSEANIATLTQVILNVLKGVNADETFTGAMEDVLEMCIRVLLRKGGGSFQELYRFLNDNRNEDLVQLGINSSNQLESEFFEDDFASSKPTKDAIRRRLKKLLNDPIFSNLMNGENTINLEEAMNTKGKVIVFNIPKGKMPNTYKYYIRFIVEYIQVLALKRADIPEAERTHTHLYIDEAHNFITSTATISEILTESRKYKLFITFSHQAITQIRDANLKDIMISMTNVKIIGKNSNKTLEAMNKTLNTKLEDVEKLETGEFYVAAGNNDTSKVNVTNRLIGGKEDISQAQQLEQTQYQLSNNYRSVASMKSKSEVQEHLNQILDAFIAAIKSIDIAYFDKVQSAPKLYEELIYNLNDESDGACGYISKQDLYRYFSLIYPENSSSDNKLLLKALKEKDDFFKQSVNPNKTYNGKKRYFIS